MTPPYVHLKYNFWADLANIATDIKRPWMLIGDFNEICSSNNKRGVKPFVSSSRPYLDDFMSFSGCIDLGFSGNPFTWRNKRSGLAHIKQRLDRAIANDEWHLLFPKAGVLHLPSIKSDHNPILAKLWMDSTKRPKPFRFEEAWTRDPSSNEDLFTSTSPTFPEDLEGLVEPIITNEENILLTSIPSREEITHALNSIPNLKAPGPDDIPSLVYKHYGNIIKPLLTSAVQSFFISGKILKEWSNTFITLVPKSKKASTFKDFRPISLCNVCYKVISKVIAGRLKPLLYKLISPNQIAFIEGRWINENGLLAQEIIHTMKTSRARKGWVTMKIDLMKAFDKLEWSFIITVLRQFGFHEKFIAWIHQCISTSAMSILINGSPHGYFSPKRGLRQGDPISPYLFVISMEILSRLMYRAEEQGAIRGIQICRGAPKISHLMFADDLLILARATTTDSNNVKNILDKFCSWSGQEKYASGKYVFLHWEWQFHLRMARPLDPRTHCRPIRMPSQHQARFHKIQHLSVSTASF
ncbi:hypothetical protein CRG98_032544 [Punica granatum]|uniref:Reverse transcriptase domain-containing protein n=1 Tax=Punica granatum TaxID=22663 RepID=A0A2I0IST1_PUNGR|nr:hypothetical protein CRG98_032544 [Punica granatum]